MKAFPWRPLRIPALIGVVTGFSLVAALLHDDALETVSVLLLGLVVVVVAAALIKGARGGSG